MPRPWPPIGRNAAEHIEEHSGACESSWKLSADSAEAAVTGAAPLIIGLRLERGQEMAPGWLCRMPAKVSIDSARLRLSEFEMADAQDVFDCITPAITRFMFWEPPASLAAYKARREDVLRSDDRSSFSFVIRVRETRECLGIASLDGVHADSPELGIWIKETAHGKGYGGEAVRAVARWASAVLRKQRLMYSAAIQNVPSRRIAESLRGEIVGTRTSPKYDSVVYSIRCETTEPPLR